MQFMSTSSAATGMSVIGVPQVPNGGNARPFEPVTSSSLRQEVSVSSAGAAGAALSTSPLHGPPSSSSSTTPVPSYQRPPSITTEDERRSRASTAAPHQPQSTSVGGGSGGGGGDEPPLTVGFFMLKDLLEAVRDLRDVNPLDIIQPFVQVVLSADTTGPITSAALLSLEKLVSHGVIGKSLTLLTK
jgi:hypothetical protein